MSLVIVRCDGSPAIGMGHVSRCLALAEELRDGHGCAVTFAMRDEAGIGVAAVRSRGYAVDVVTGHDGPEIRDRVAARLAHALVVDVREGPSRAALDAIRTSGVRVVTIDDGTERRLASDLAFYPPVPQVDELDWSGFRGQRFTGWEWVILRREFAIGSRESDGPPATDVLVTMGGSDPVGMTEFAMGALDRLPMPLAVHVVLGPGFSRPLELLDRVARSTHDVRVSCAPLSIGPLMQASRIAVVSFGVTAYELAACGVPSVHLCLTDDHARASSAFDREGIAKTLGVFGQVQPQQVADAVAHLLSDAGLRAAIAARARQLVDGRGAKRVAALVTAGLS